MFNWLSFVLYLLVATLTPGPNNIMSMNFASKIGFKKSYLFNIGVLIGGSITMLFCAIFTSLLFNYIPKIQFPMKIIGATYMLYLAWKSLYIKIDTEIKEIKVNMLMGTLLQFINAKALISGINVMSSFILPYFKQTIYIIGFALLIAFMGFIAGIFWGLFGTLFRTVFKKHGKIINVIMALLLIYCAISLFI